MSKPRLFTIGHSDRTMERFIDIIEHSSIRLVIDIRSNPASARYPWFERAALTKSLETAGFSYRWMRALGGRKPDQAGQDQHSGLPSELRSYAMALNSQRFDVLSGEIIQLASSTNLVLLCAEKNPEDCHRSLLGDKLTVLGARVVHIIDQEEAREHSLHPSLTQQSDGKILYRDNQLSFL